MTLAKGDKLVDLRRSEKDRREPLEASAVHDMPEIHFGLRGMFDQEDLERMGVEEGEHIEAGDALHGHFKLHVLSAHTDKTPEGTKTRVHWGMTHARLEDDDGGGRAAKLYRKTKVG